MKVTSSALQWQVQHSATRVQAQSTRLESWVGQRPTRAAAATGQPSARAPVSASAAVVARNAPAPQAASSTKARDADPAKALTPHLAMVRDLIERMTGIRAQELRLADAPAADPVVLQDPRAAAVASPRPEFGLEFEQHTVLEETEQTQWAAQGVVHTADGQEIRFGLQLQMQRSYREETHLLVRLGNAAQPVDPLVINFGGTAAQLQDLRFAFDLDGDGHTEQVPLLAGQRAYLALDGNRNQRIDGGHELFGPATGNGYSELAEHDEDGNGWIDATTPCMANCACGPQWPKGPAACAPCKKPVWVPWRWRQQTPRSRCARPTTARWAPCAPPACTCVKTAAWGARSKSTWWPEHRF
jgi:hypothetical protein